MQTKNFNDIFRALKDLAPVLTSGNLLVVLSSCVWFAVQTHLGLPQESLSIGATVFQSGHLHRLLLFPLHHRSLPQLLLSAAALLFLCGGVEKGLGTVRFLFLLLLLGSTTGVFYSFLDLLQDASVHTEGLLPVVLACVALTTLHTKMTKGFLCGVSFPVVALPWVLLVICTALIPRSVLLCNVIAILVGWVYGKGWLSPVDMSESRAAVLEKLLPFRFLRSMSGVLFVPASSQERRRTLLPQINPTPGSYPVQAYAPLPSIATANATATMYEGWPQLASLTPPHTPYGHTAAHNVGHIAAHKVGHMAAHNVGHMAAHNVGHIAAHKVGHMAAHKVGHMASHNVGHMASHNVGHMAAHHVGHMAAHQMGHNHGQISAQSVGHNHGHFSDQSVGHGCDGNHSHNHGAKL
ncbi:rhomboid domain-containing protein 2-like [Fundulus heteroclitus]|uniref:rhomboid domain-containing protein 2-like n=1 Tax=Fundulus heteroclitus TaxID=8078 RepID=UPI00165C1E68|nr:rhomboid domain-containing protein 2-like [Fundulus heteroclitus]